MKSALFETRGLCKSFDSFLALEDVSLSFEQGKIYGLLGENGAGKSTFLKILFGLYSPTEGEIFVDGLKVNFKSPRDAIELGFGMVQQHFCLIENATALENIILGDEPTNALGLISKQEAVKRIEERLPSNLLKIPWHHQVETFSVGQKQKLELLKLIYRDAKILFLDEPTAVLTPQEVEELFSLLKDLKLKGYTIILITHKVREVLKLCDRFAVLRQGKLVAEGLVQEETEPSLVKKMMGKDQKSVERAEVSANQPRKTLIELKNISDLAARGCLQQVSMKFHEREIVGLAGVEGSGQLELVEVLSGIRSFLGELLIEGKPAASYSARFLRQWGLGLIPQERKGQGLWFGETVVSNLMVGLEKKFSRQSRLMFEDLEKKCTPFIEEIELRAPSLTAPVELLSGGNQQKVAFLREVMLRQPKFLIAHQLTRGVDMKSSFQLHSQVLALKEQGSGIFLLSSDLDELFLLCDRIYVMFHGKVTLELKRSEFDMQRVGQAMLGPIQ